MAPYLEEPVAREAEEFYRQANRDVPIPTETLEYKDVDSLAYEMSRVPMRTSRPLKIICCGAGFSGLDVAHAVQSGKLENCSLTIYEKNSAIGGTWLENRYPGCACDIPIHIYQYSWAPYSHFNNFYAERADILDYLLKVADQFNLNPYVQTSRKVLGAKWIAEKSKWEVTIGKTDGREIVFDNDHMPGHGLNGETFTEECDVFINASGAYNNWRWPDIPNRETYRGLIVHSSQWGQDVDVKGKHVALIGNGSSGIQILPNILDSADKLTVLLRSKTWVTPSLANRFSGGPGTNKNYTQEEKEAWDKSPEDYLKLRKDIESELNVRFRLYLKGSNAQAMGKKMTTEMMTERLSAKPELVDQLLPDFAVGCRRPTPGIGYLEALCSPKVEIIWGELDTFNETGIRTKSGQQVDADAIVCATGFNMGFVPRFPIIGSHGRDLRDDWTKELPASVLGVVAEDMPNYFIYMGPTSPLGHGSIIGSIEHVTNYMAKFLKKLQTENYASVVPKAGVCKAWRAHALKWMAKTVWVEGCPSSFKNGVAEAPVVSLHPGSRLHYFDLLANPRYEDFEWSSLTKDPMHMFAWLGDGFTADETFERIDLSYYMEGAPHLKN